MARRFDTVSFLSDYGVVDEFVGVVKAVLRDLAPHAAVIDLTHHIRPYDVRGGSLALARCVNYLPEGVVLAVVDPGVGTDRRGVAIEVAGGQGVFVGPDNGLLAPAVAMAGGAERAIVLDRAEHHLPAPGATFAGRDVFAPVAAQLCLGIDLAELGTLIDPNLLLPGLVPLSRVEDDGELHGEVLWVDQFGNCQLNIGPDEIVTIGEHVRVRAGEEVRVARQATNFAEIGPGAVALITDSYGMLALALDRRSAAEELRLAAGDQVVLSALDDGEQVKGAGITSPVTLRPGR